MAFNPADGAYIGDDHLHAVSDVLRSNGLLSFKTSCRINPDEGSQDSQTDNNAFRAAHHREGI